MLLDLLHSVRLPILRFPNCKLLIALLGGRYLTRRHHQKALEILLVDSSALIGWPVHLIIQDLKYHWSTSERAP